MWVADNILHGGSLDNLVAAMVESGIEEKVCRPFVEATMVDPCIEAAHLVIPLRA